MEQVLVIYLRRLVVEEGGNTLWWLEGIATNSFKNRQTLTLMALGDTFM